MFNPVKNLIDYIKSDNKNPEWIHLDYKSYRWKTSFAFLPVKTFDKGWIWFQSYYREQISSGWGSFDDFPYMEIKDDSSEIAK